MLSAVWPLRAVGKEAQMVNRFEVDQERGSSCLG